MIITKDNQTLLKQYLYCAILIIIFPFLNPTKPAYAQETSGFVIENNVLTAYYGTDTDIVIPDGGTRIDEEVFFQNYTIEKVTIPDTVTSIGQVAFKRCISLTTVKFGKSLKTIEAGAFSECSSLSELSIPSGVKEIDADAFENTPWLEAKIKAETPVIVNGILINGSAA